MGICRKPHEEMIFASHIHSSSVVSLSAYLDDAAPFFYRFPTAQFHPSRALLKSGGGRRSSKAKAIAFGSAARAGRENPRI